MSKHTTRERWLPIPGYDGWYEVSSLGRVRSVERTFTNKLGRTRTFPGVIMKTRVGSCGYPMVHLRRQGSSKMCTVHRLVMLAFVGPCPEGMEVLHGDGDKTNHALSNLRYGTKSENSYDAVKHKQHPKTKRTHCPRGHELVEPNLIVGHLKRGQRECRSCGNASTWLRNHPESGMTLQLVSDDRYARIMG